MIRVIAFDCFGTVFNMSSISREQIAAYVQHVKQEDFSPYQFPQSWYELKAHPDAADGIELLRSMGYTCVTLSNGSAELLSHLSKVNLIEWDKIIDLVAHRAYKPHNLDAYRAVEKETGIPPSNTLLVTANPTFGDVGGAAAIGMKSMVIRGESPIRNIIQLATYLQDTEGK